MRKSWVPTEMVSLSKKTRVETSGYTVKAKVVIPFRKIGIIFTHCYPPKVAHGWWTPENGGPQKEQEIPNIGNHQS